MNDLEIRKEMLITESGLNRLHLFADLERLTTQVGTLAAEYRSMGSIASSAASLVAGLTTIERHGAHEAAAKTPWWQNLLGDARLITSVLQLFGSRGRAERDR